MLFLMKLLFGFCLDFLLPKFWTTQEYGCGRRKFYDNNDARQTVRNGMTIHLIISK